MEDGDSYRICGIMVREYKSKNFLSTAREGSSIISRKFMTLVPSTKWVVMRRTILTTCVPVKPMGKDQDQG